MESLPLASNQTYYVPDGVQLPGDTDSAWFTEQGRDYLRQKGIIDDRLGNGHLIKDSGDDAIEKLANELNVKLDDETKDYLMQYYLNQQSDKVAWDRQMEASNSQYQRAVADLRKAGLNPFLAFQGLGGSSPSASGSSVQGGLYTSSKTSKYQAKTSADAKMSGTIFTVLAMIAVAIIGAL